MFITRSILVKHIGLCPSTCIRSFRKCIHCHTTLQPQIWSDNCTKWFLLSLVNKVVGHCSILNAYIWQVVLLLHIHRFWMYVKHLRYTNKSLVVLFEWKHKLVFFISEHLVFQRNSLTLWWFCGKWKETHLIHDF